MTCYILYSSHGNACCVVYHVKGAYYTFLQYKEWKNKTFTQIRSVFAMQSQGQAMVYISYNLSEGNRFNSLSILPKSKWNGEKTFLPAIMSMYAELLFAKDCFDCFVALLLQQKIIRACCSPVSHSMSQLVKNKIIVQQAALRKATLFNSSLFWFCYACLTISQKEMAIKTISCIFFPKISPLVKCAVVRFVHLRDLNVKSSASPNWLQ